MKGLQRTAGCVLSAATPGPARGAKTATERQVWVGAAALAAVLFSGGLVGVPEARAQEPPADVPPVAVDTVLVEGARRRSEAAVLADIGIRSGDVVDFRTIQRALHRLWASGQYADAQVYVRDRADDPLAPVTLIFRVVEQPYVAAIEFRGLQNVGAGTIRDTVGLQAGGPLRPSKVAEAKVMTRQLLAKKGIHLGSVEHRLEEIPGRPGEHRLIFDVDEGQRVAIAEIEFEGNEHFTDERLRAVLATKKEGFFWFRDGTYDEEKLRADLRERLPAFYGANGYIDFAVLGDTLIVDPETGKARLVVRVHEGPQYLLAGFEVEGNRRFPTADLRRYFERERGGLLRTLGLGGGNGSGREGEVFDQVAFQEATDKVAQLYRNQGYLRAQVEPRIERTETEDGRPAVRVAWDIIEREPAHIRRVTIEGNTRTHERVIRERILVLPGDVYSEELLIQSYQNIMALGFFETPLPLPEIENAPNGDVDITFRVTERQTGSFNFGTAVGGGTGLAGFVGFDEPNLFGQAKSGHLRWEFGRYSNNIEASYGDPAIMGSRVSGSLALFSARDRFIQFPEGQRRRTGGSVQFGFPLPFDRWSRLFVGYSLARTTYEQFTTEQTSSLFALPPGVQSTISLGLARNTLNHPMFPTNGTRQELRAELSGGILGGDGDFQKYTASGQWYVPVGQVGGGQPGSRPIRFTLGFTAEAGVLFGDASRFPFERFWMGGVQFGQPLRGYDETTVTPLGYRARGPQTPLEERFGDAFLRLSAEYAIRFNDNISLSFFYDAGGVWREPGQINPTKLLRGAGVGVTLVTPFGPLGLDYAYGFDKDVPGWQLHFKLGPGF